MSAMNAAPFRVGDWYVEPASGQMTAGDRVVRLEPRVMEMLVYLAGRPGQVVSREELEQVLWQGRVISYDALTSTVQKLRRAFADDVRHPRFIETLSKRGYRLVAPVGTPADVDTASPLADRHTPSKWNRHAWPWIIAGTVLALAVTTLTLERLQQTQPAVVSGEQASPYSIAVLPFDNLSGDSEQEYFADGMTDDLITALARHNNLFVISRDSTFLYKGRSFDVRDVARTLNVRYVLHGSIRRAAGDIRFNVQLVDGETGSHLWAERFDGKSGEVFSLQEQVIREVLAALETDQSAFEAGGESQRRAGNPEAYDYFLHGRNRFFRYASREENLKARALYRQALELDPDFALAHAMTAWTYAFEAMNGWSEQREESLAQAEELASRAIAIDAALPVAYFVRGLVFRERGDYMKALVEAEKAIAHDPNYANAHVLHATLLYYAGRPQEGLERIKRAMRLNPHHPYNYPFHMGQAYFILQQYQQAIEALERGLESNPSSERMRVWLAAAYALSGREDDARWEAEQVLTLNPDFSLERIRQAFPFQEQVDLDRFLYGLHLAGITQ